jgi:hypothetical protein
MGILSFFTKAEASLPSIEHPVFGKMEATLVNDDGSYFWETPEHLDTLKGPIGVFCDGPVEGPSDEQVALWNWIYENSERLAKLAEPLLVDRLQSFGLQPQAGNLVWSAVGLARDGHKDSPWDMSFNLSAENHRLGGAILTAYFEGGAPTGVSIDS